MKDLKNEKIAIINDKGYNVGIGRYAFNLNKNLLDHNLNSTLYQLFSLSRESDNVVNFPGLSFTKYKQEINEVFLKFYLHKIRKLVNADIIHISDPGLADLFKIFPKALLTVHDLYYLEHRGNSLLMSMHMKRAYKKIKKFNYILSDSENTKNELIEKLRVRRDKIFVVYPAVNSDKFANSVKKNKSLIGFRDEDVVLINVSYDNPNKNLRFLYKILAKLPAEYKLIRIGRNRQENINYAKFLGVYNRIKFLESINDDELVKYYHNSDIFVYPTLYEGFGFGNIEAMASRLPVISSDIPVINEVVGKYGILLNPNDIDLWVDSIKKLSDPSTNKYYSTIGPERAYEFSFNKQFERLKIIYDKIM